MNNAYFEHLDWSQDSDRERALALRAEGRSSEDIAAELSVSVDLIDHWARLATAEASP